MGIELINQRNDCFFYFSFFMGFSSSFFFSFVTGMHLYISLFLVRANFMRG